MSSVPPTSASRSRMPSSPKPDDAVVRIEAAAVVAHRTRDLAAAVAHAHFDARRLRVLGDVGQRLLDDPVDRRLDLRRVPELGVPFS